MNYIDYIVIEFAVAIISFCWESLKVNFLVNVLQLFFFLVQVASNNQIMWDKLKPPRVYETNLQNIYLNR